MTHGNQIEAGRLRQSGLCHGTESRGKRRGRGGSKRCFQGGTNGDQRTNRFWSPEKAANSVFFWVLKNVSPFFHRSWFMLGKSSPNGRTIQVSEI